MGIPSKTCSLKQVNPLIGPQVKTLVDGETSHLLKTLPGNGRGVRPPFRESVASPGQQIVIGRLSAVNPGPAEASGGKPSRESRFHAGIFFQCFLSPSVAGGNPCRESSTKC
jgi:hypothetical protein